MKSNPLYCFAILCATLLCTVYTSIKTVFKSLLGTVTKTWCDEELKRWVNRILKLIQIKYKLVNPKNIAPKHGQPTIIMCNHSSLFDIPLSFHAFPNQSIRMLAKHELFKVPFFGKSMIAAGFPRITRNNRRQAIQDLAVVEKMLRSGTVIWVAPEGRRSHDGKLVPFKKGAFITAINTHATIIPIGIRGGNTILPAKSLKLNLGQEVEVHVGEPIDTKGYTLENKEALIAAVREEMLALVGED